MQNQIESFIESEKNKAKDRVFNKVEIGMTKDDVIELMGEPAFTEDKYYGNEVRELWFYLDSATEKYIQFYFEKNTLKESINKNTNQEVLFLLRRHLSEQYLTLSQSLRHFFLHVNFKLHVLHILKSKFFLGSFKINYELLF